MKSKKAHIPKKLKKSKILTKRIQKQSSKRKKSKSQSISFGECENFHFLENVVEAMRNLQTKKGNLVHSTLTQNQSETNLLNVLNYKTKLLSSGKSAINLLENIKTEPFLTSRRNENVLATEETQMKQNIVDINLLKNVNRQLLFKNHSGKPQLEKKETKAKPKQETLNGPILKNFISFKNESCLENEMEVFPEQKPKEIEIVNIKSYGTNILQKKRRPSISYTRKKKASSIEKCLDSNFYKSRIRDTLPKVKRKSYNALESKSLNSTNIKNTGNKNPELNKSSSFNRVSHNIKFREKFKLQKTKSLSKNVKNKINLGLSVCRPKSINQADSLSNTFYSFQNKAETLSLLVNFDKMPKNAQTKLILDKLENKNFLKSNKGTDLKKTGNPKEMIKSQNQNLSNFLNNKFPVKRLTYPNCKRKNFKKSKSFYKKIDKEKKFIKLSMFPHLQLSPTQSMF